jgi:hypothetical protein
MWNSFARRSIKAPWILAGVFALGLAPGRCEASDRFIVGFDAGNPCGGVVWEQQTLVHNLAGSPATIILAHISNGGPAAHTATQATVQGGGTMDLYSLFWRPADPNATIWVTHVELPDSIILESRFGVRLGGPGCLVEPPLPFERLGAFPFQASTSLVPANQPQVHLSVGVPGTGPSRVNVGVYNAGAVPATAILDARQTCDDALLDRRTLTVPPDTALEIPDAVNVTTSQCDTAVEPPFKAYVAVTMDQDGLSWVSSIGNGFPAPIPVNVSLP